MTFFNVVDVGFNSIFLKANKDLVTLLDDFGLKNKIDSYIKMTEKSLNKLYDKKRNFSKDLKITKRSTFHL